MARFRGGSWKSYACLRKIEVKSAAKSYHWPGSAVVGSPKGAGWPSREVGESPTLSVCAAGSLLQGEVEILVIFAARHSSKII